MHQQKYLESGKKNIVQVQPNSEFLSKSKEYVDSIYTSIRCPYLWYMIQASIDIVLHHLCRWGDNILHDIYIVDMQFLLAQLNDGGEPCRVTGIQSASKQELIIRHKPKYLN